MRVRIAICQILCCDGDRPGNFVRIERALRQARAEGAQIACLPEMCLFGWVNPDAHERAEPIPGSDSDQLCDFAREYGLHMCVGLAEKDADRLYDTAVLIDENGSILLKHRKINLLSELMDPPYTPGSEAHVAETRFGRVGLLICADTHDEQILAQMAAARPDLVLVPYGYAEKSDKWPGHGKELARVVVNTAGKTGAVAVGANVIGQITHGPWAGRVYGGQSLAAGPTGEVIVKAADRDRNIVVFEASVPGRT